MSDEQNLEKGEGNANPKPENPSANDASRADTWTGPTNKTSEALKSLIAPTKSSQSEDKSSTPSPKISSITGKVVAPGSKVQNTGTIIKKVSPVVSSTGLPAQADGADAGPGAKPITAAAGVAASSDAASPAEAASGPAPSAVSAAPGNHNETATGASDTQDIAPVAAPPAPPVVQETETESGLFSWSSGHVLDIIGEKTADSPGKSEPRVSATASVEDSESAAASMNTGSAPPAVAAHGNNADQRESVSPPESAQAADEQQATAESQSGQQIQQGSDNPRTTNSGLAAAIANRFQQNTTPPATPVANSVPPDSGTPVAPSAVPPAPEPPVASADPTTTAETPSAANFAPAEPPRPVISIKASDLPAGYNDFDASGISDEEFLDEPSNNPSTKKYSLIGQTLFDNYAVLDLIGEGSLCYVYTAMQLSDEAIVAVKTPKTVTPAIKERFQQAVIKQGKLKHPHIIRSLQYLESPDGKPFYIMENKQGVTLDEILQSVEKLDDEDAIALILTQTASALEYAHEHGVTHDRLSPHNIMLIDENEQLQVNVSDFQIATVIDITGDTTSKTKALSFISPEVLRGEPGTQKSDVYSLAALAYRMITGKVPFHGIARTDSESTPEPLAKYNPDLKQVHDLNQIIQEALEFEPNYRVETVAAFREAVQKWILSVHEEFAREQEYYTSEFEQPQIELEPSNTKNSPDAPQISPIGIILPQSQPPSKSQLQPTKAPPTAPQAPTPPVVSADELDKMVHEVAPQQRRRIRRAQSRTGPQNIRSTIRELVALKRKQSEQEQTTAMKFTEQIASQTEGPRRSPLATATRLIAFLLVCGGITIACVTYILTNPTQVREMYFQASRQLSGLLSGKSSEPAEEAAIEEGPKIVRETASKLPQPKRKLKPSEIHATPPEWAVPRQPGQPVEYTQSPSFGVTNNSTSPKRRPSRVRIEYRDFASQMR